MLRSPFYEFVRILLVTLLVWGGQQARAEGLETVAKVRFEPDRVVFKPHDEPGQLVLTVTGPHGLYFSRNYEGSREAVLKLQDDYNEPLPDGGYTFELTSVPRIDPEVRKQMQAARERGDDQHLAYQLRRDGKLPKPVDPQGGHFLIREGKVLVLDATLKEPTDREARDETAR